MKQYNKGPKEKPPLNPAMAEALERAFNNTQKKLIKIQSAPCGGKIPVEKIQAAIDKVKHESKKTP